MALTMILLGEKPKRLKLEMVSSFTKNAVFENILARRNHLLVRMRIKGVNYDLKR